MKEEKIRVLALLPTECAKMVTIDNTLGAMQQFVGGLIECLLMDDPEADIDEVIQIAQETIQEAIELYLSLIHI